MLEPFQILKAEWENMNIFEKLNVETNQLTENEYNLVNKIIQKYKKFLD